MFLTDNRDFWMQLVKEKDTEIKQLKKELSKIEGRNAGLALEISDAKIKLKESEVREVKLTSTIHWLRTELLKCRKQLSTSSGRIKTLSAAM